MLGNFTPIKKKFEILNSSLEPKSVVEIETTPEMVSNVYKKSEENISKFRKIMGRPLTLAEKILAGHLVEIEEKNLDDSKNYVFLKPDRVALQDVTGQMVILQFIQAGLKQTSLPTTVHCDHLIRAKVEGETDMRVSLDENSEAVITARSYVIYSAIVTSSYLTIKLNCIYNMV